MTKGDSGSLVLFSLLLNIANLLRKLLQCVFVSGVLQLKVYSTVISRCFLDVSTSFRPCCLFAGAACDAMAAVSVIDSLASATWN
jgi:hypothetical protein